MIFTFIKQPYSLVSLIEIKRSGMWLLADEMCMCIYIASSYAKASNKNIKRRSTYQKQGKTMTRENQGESKKDCK
jgi:hypothetical protein